MATISVYLAEEDERKRRKTNKRLALAAGSVLALIAIGKREPPAPFAGAAPAPPPRVVEKIVYVDRPVLQYAGPVGPVAPVIAPAAPVIAPPRPVTPKPKAKPRTAIAEQKPAPAPVAAPPPTVAPTPAPPRVIIARPLLIEPRSLHFVSGGRQLVAVTNPNGTAMQVHAIRILLPAGVAGGFELRDHERCIKTLAPGERCTFSVIAAPNTRGAVSVNIDHDA